MRNLQERTYFCNDCGIEVQEGHGVGHNVRMIPIAQIPWNARREWLDESNDMTEQAHFWDEE